MEETSFYREKHISGTLLCKPPTSAQIPACPSSLPCYSIPFPAENHLASIHCSPSEANLAGIPVLPFPVVTVMASVLFPHPIMFLPLPTHPPPSFTFPPRSLPPAPFVIEFFSTPMGLGHFSLLNFLSSVDCILVTLYFLTSTY